MFDRFGLCSLLIPSRYYFLNSKYLLLFFTLFKDYFSIPWASSPYKFFSSSSAFDPRLLIFILISLIFFFLTANWYGLSRFAFFYTSIEVLDVSKICFRTGMISSSNSFVLENFVQNDVNFGEWNVVFVFCLFFLSRYFAGF